MRELRVTPIKNGTVIDHIPAGMALKVLRILGIGDSVASTVTVAMHVPSRIMGWKDIVKVEDRELGALLLKNKVICTPGIAFGSRGAGHIRFSYANSLENIAEALRRLEAFLAQRSA